MNACRNTTLDYQAGVAPMQSFLKGCICIIKCCDEQITIFLECAHIFNNNLCFCMLKVINAEISIAHIPDAIQRSQITTGI